MIKSKNAVILQHKGNKAGISLICVDGLQMTGTLDLIRSSLESLRNSEKKEGDRKLLSDAFWIAGIIGPVKDVFPGSLRKNAGN